MHGRMREGLLTALLLIPVNVLAVEVGQVAPALTLASIAPHGLPISLSDYRGKVVYLDFWSAWCAPCRRDMPGLAALRDDLSQDSFEVLAVNVDPVVADARRFLAQVPVSYPIAIDATANAATRFGVSVLPAAFLIDGDGIVRRIYSGEDAGDVLAIGEHVRLLINGPDKPGKGG